MLVTGRLLIFTDYMARNLITVRNTNLCLEITVIVGLIMSYVTYEGISKSFGHHIDTESYSRTSMARTPLDPLQYVRDRGSSG